ncbi:DUF2868 domain-containing protein [Isoalcanivorax beigongshangi]|uniref:DUF2868 domain-containing protein n=1 Tax=Isoalcanivorax beigongshangi TaxID=3238810 RepID=A0ABV4AFJ6_9GAMM
MRRPKVWTLSRLLLRRHPDPSATLPAWPTPLGDAPEQPLAPVSDLQRLVDIHAAWEARPQPTAESFHALLRRGPMPSKAMDRLDAWLCTRFPDGHSPGTRLSSSLGWLGAVTLLVGALMGFGVMAALVAYDGSARVNLLWILGLALLQTVLSLVAALLMFRRRPKLTLLSGFTRLWPARCLRGPMRQLITGSRRDGLLDALHVPLLMLLAQQFALAFSVAALASLLLHLSAQDIAFGWNSTLEISATGMHHFLHALAWPWHWLSAAVPSLELVEASHYYRLRNAAPPLADPVMLGRWWPFLVAMWVVYAVLPRALLLLWCARRWRRMQHLTLQEAPLYRHTLSHFVFDHHSARLAAADVISASVERMLRHTESADLSADQDAQQLGEQLTHQWQQALTQAEREALEALAIIYLQDGPTLAASDTLDLPDSEQLFALEHWERWGLSKTQLAMLAGLGGTAAGGGLDLATGGVTMGALAATFGIGAAASVYFSTRIAAVTADAGTVRVGPAQHRQLPWVLLGRQLSAWQLLVRNVPGSTPASGDIPDWRSGLNRRQERQLEKLFSLYRKGAGDETRQRLAEQLITLMDRLHAPVVDD